LSGEKLGSEKLGRAVTSSVAELLTAGETSVAMATITCDSGRVIYEF